MPDLTGEQDEAVQRARGPLDPRLLRWAPLRRHLIVSGVAAVVMVVAVLALAFGIGRYLPALVHGREGTVGPLVLTLLVVAALRGFSSSLATWSSTLAMSGTRRLVRHQVLDHLARLTAPARSQAGPSRVAALLTTGLDALEPWARGYVPALTTAAVVPPVAGLVILVADPWSALIMVIAVPLIPVFMVLIGRMTEERTSREWATLQRLAGHFLDVLTGLPTLRLFGRAEAQVANVADIADRYRRAVLKTLRVAFLSAAVLELIATLSVALVAVSLGVRLVNGSIGLERALIVLLLAPECVLPLRRVGAAFHASTAGLDVADEVEAFLALPTVSEGDQGVPATGALSARRVVVDDPDRGRRLGPADLLVEPGQVVVVRGPNGAGKSTLVDVLRGVISPDAGQVLVGAVGIDRMSLEDRSRAIAWVPQQPAPLDDTVGASVWLGPVGATDEARQEALRPFGLVGSMDRDPTSLSGGENQRLAVARALLAVRRGEARFVVADEPTAHLDDDATAYVAAELVDAAHQGAGVLVVTHDPRLDLITDIVVELGEGGTEHRGAADSNAETSTDVPPTVPAGELPAGQDRTPDTDGTGLPGPVDEVGPGSVSPLAVTPVSA